MIARDARRTGFATPGELAGGSAVIRHEVVQDARLQAPVDQVLGEDALGLFDQHPAQERALQLIDDGA